jgi:hypothetical protein
MLEKCSATELHYQSLFLGVFFKIGSHYIA